MLGYYLYNHRKPKNKIIRWGLIYLWEIGGMAIIWYVFLGMRFHLF
jgi:hypothetical protein